MAGVPAHRPKKQGPKRLFALSLEEKETMRKTTVAAILLMISMSMVCCMKRGTTVSATDILPIGVRWYLTQVGGSPVSLPVDGKQPYMALDPAKRQVTGFAGCNNFFGNYELDGSSLNFGPIGTTRMACPDLEMGLETKLFEALQSTRKWKIEDGDLLLLETDAALARFSREQSDAAKAYTTKTGKRIIVSQPHPAGESIGTIEVRTEGFEHNFKEVFEDRDPISDVFVADLDGNGFDEIYIVTTAAGSGSYGTILGFASNKDKSLSMIHFPEIRKGDSNFEGYMGHDTFKIEGRKLVRIFPVYQEEDTNENPTGGRRKLLYGLIPGEAGWQLRIINREELKGQ
jgi:heat shock protein HslJ